MDRLESIKDGYKMWENRYPLNPPETFTQKLAAQHAKDLAKSFEQLAPNHVGYLLQRLERCEKALKVIATPASVRNNDKLILDYEFIILTAQEALDEAIQP